MLLSQDAAPGHVRIRRAGQRLFANDPEIDDMYRTYRPPTAAYFVLVSKDRVAAAPG